jgi:ESS family glutamate:Na+ symporter
MTISPWILLVLAVPVLLVGEFLVKRIGFLSRYNIPAPVVGGLLVSVLILLANIAGMSVGMVSKTDAQWWTWLVTTETDWQNKPKLDVHRPFLVAFFTCIGLNASWVLVKRGGRQVVTFLIIAALLAVFQNAIGALLAKLMGAPLLLGVICGSLTMTGGHATALGFASEFEKAGFASAGVIGAAAATFGLVAGGLIGGATGGRLIRKYKLQSAAPKEVHLQSGQTAPAGIINDLRILGATGAKFIPHLLILLACIKAGAWVSHWIQQVITVPVLSSETGGKGLVLLYSKITFPVYMGALLLGVLIRNIVDVSGRRWIHTEIIDNLASVTLGIFLAIAMTSLNLRELAGTAGPMLLIMGAQVLFMALFAYFVTFRVMGGDFEAAVMAGGHCGFGLGATPNAVANMKSLVETFGPAPRAFLVVPIVGAFLLDFFNAMNITFFLNLLK